MTTPPDSTINTNNAAWTDNEITAMMTEFRFPAGVRVRIPLPEDKPSRPKPGEICLHPVAFDCGLRLPFHPFIRTVLAYLGLAPSQLGPNAWRHIVGSIILWRLCSKDQDHITLDEFNYCYRFKYKRKTGHWYLFSREDRTLVLDCPNYSTKHWSDKFFFASGEGWEFSPEEEGTLAPVPTVPKDWGSVDNDKLKEPILSNLYKCRVNRALAFESDCRNYRNLITQENINKYLLGNTLTLSSPSLPRDVSLRSDPKSFPESSRRARGRKRRISITEGGPDSRRSTKQLCSVARSKLRNRSKSSIPQIAPAPPNHLSSDQPHVRTRRFVVESSSSESSVQIVDQEKKGPSLLYRDDLVLERVNQLLTSDEMRQIEELECDKALEKGICHSAKALVMMVALSARLGTELRKKQVSEQEKSVAALKKVQNAYLAQLATTYMLSKELETIKDKLAETEKSVKDQEEAIRAKDVELHAREEEILAKTDELRAKDDQIQALQDAAVNAVKQFTESGNFENLMAQYYLQVYDAFCSQASALPPYAEWSSLEPYSGREQKPT